MLFMGTALNHTMLTTWFIYFFWQDSFVSVENLRVSTNDMGVPYQVEEGGLACW